MEATCWTDYLCPWCYLAGSRDAVFEELGVTVTHLPFELHPEIGLEGRRVRPDGRLGSTFDRIAAECEQLGLPFRRPDRMPNTRRALETSEWVRRNHPDAFAELHLSLFAAHFVTGEPLDDADVIDALVARAGAPASAARAAVDAGLAAPHVSASMAQARELGITSTPTWVVGEGLVIPGALEPDTVRRWVTKLLART